MRRLDSSARQRPRWLWSLALPALAAMALAGPAQASLVSLGNGTVLDTATNLIWLQDWNPEGTS